MHLFRMVYAERVFDGIDGVVYINWQLPHRQTRHVYAVTRQCGFISMSVQVSVGRYVNGYMFHHALMYNTPS